MRWTVTRCVVLAGLLGLCGVRADAGRATGPLRVLETNPRYFTDGSGRAILMVGSHTWEAQQDLGPNDPPRTFDYTGFIDMMAEHDHNFMRYWMYETAKYAPWAKGDYYYRPLPWARTGPGKALDGKPKFDLTKFNQFYFDRMRERVTAAGERGIYCAIMLFQGWSIEKKGRRSGNPWPGHPFNRENNVNRIDGDLNGDGEGEEIHTLANPEVTRLQEAYVRKVVDTVNDLHNVLYEIANETHGKAVKWHYHIIDYIHEYEATKPEQHPVGMTGCGPNSGLFASPAEWISPWGSGGYRDNPPASDGSKVIISDTDHIRALNPEPQWIWQSFCRGLNYIFMDWADGHVLRGNRSKEEPMRKNLGYVRSYADMMDLAAMTPQDSLSSTRYCLANAAARDAEYLVYLPSGGACTVDLSATQTAVHVEWFNPRTDRIVDGGVRSRGSRRSFKTPWEGESVLYLSGRADFFGAAPAVIARGNSCTLAWHIRDATDVRLGRRRLEATGSMKVSPRRTTKYTLTARGPAGPISEEATVTVGEPAALTSIVVEPPSATVLPGGEAKFTARALDQYGNPIACAVRWKVSGGGSMTKASGTTKPTSGAASTFTSDGTQKTFTVTASSGNVMGTARVAVAKILMRINCGANEYEVKGWERDDRYVTGGNDFTFPSTPDLAGVETAAPRNVYRTCRHMDHSYSFPSVPNGTYTVRLHFFDALGGPGRAMDYSFEGKKVLDDFCIAKEAGGAKALVKEFKVTVSDGDGLQIVAKRDKGDDAFECAIEIMGGAP